MNANSPTFEYFQQQAETTLELVRSLSTEDKVRAAHLWNTLSTKLQSIIDNEDIFHTPAPLDNVGSELSENETNTKPIISAIRSQDIRSLTDMEISCPRTPTELLQLDDAVAIDKVLDGVIHLEAEKEILSQLKSSTTTTFSSVSSQVPIQEAVKDINIEPELITSDLPEESNTNKALWSCRVCGSLFGTEKSFTIHENLHLKPPRPFQCDQCPAGFSTRGNFNVHLRSHSGERRFSCTKCSSKFITSGNLRRHVLAHHDNLKPYRCSICQGCFTEKKSLANHQRVHTGERPYACPLCSKKFTQSSVLKSHLSVHSSEKKFSCSKCTMLFKQKSCLRRHISYVHSNAKNYDCLECGSAFVTNSDLQRHVKSHKGEKGFVCEKCGKRFMRHEHLTQHNKHHHLKETK